MVKEQRKQIEFYLSVARTIFAMIGASASIITATFIIGQHFHK